MTTQNITIGLDLGDRHHHVCVLDAAGEILAREGIVNTRDAHEKMTWGGQAGREARGCPCYDINP